VYSADSKYEESEIPLTHRFWKRKSIRPAEPTSLSNPSDIALFLIGKEPNTDLYTNPLQTTFSDIIK